MRRFWLESSGKILLSLLFLFLSSVPALGFLQESSAIDLSLDGTRDLKIVAVMVEFIEDTNRFTSGNGTFGPGSIPYLEDPGTNVDALPHNRRYFEAHLEFVKNYFETVSNGNLTIEYGVLPEVIQLNQKMAHYSPIGPDPDISILSKLVKDTWSRFENDSIESFPFGPDEDLVFVIFHAGIGRDVELTGTSLDKTPQDIPSVYLSREALSQFLDDPAFSGFPIQNGDILVNHSLILPRTLSRAGTDAAGSPFVIPLSINGLLAAQIGSHIGLPDLFNTETGRSAIGRFGLMDGASIFSYNGLFPPEPSAWEKSVLGWTKPFVVNPENSDQISLPAVSIREPQSIAKVELTGSEYFLIENRHRDPGNDGVTLTIRKSDGTAVQQTFRNSDTPFINQEQGFDQLLEAGVVIDVSNYDFSLPGGIVEDQNVERELNGGILVWHIDEAAIASGLETGSVNNTENRKGVDLEEADGPQDIGNPVDSGLFQNSVNGSPFDFWWAGNNSSVIVAGDTLQIYENRFAPDTTPHNNSNSGAQATFELYGFSDNLPVASVNIRRVEPNSGLYRLETERTLDDLFQTEQISPYSIRFPLSLTGFTGQQNSAFYLPGLENLWIYNLEDQSVLSIKHGLENLQQPFVDSSNDRFALAEIPDFSKPSMPVKGYQLLNDSPEGLFDYESAPNRAFLSSDSGELLEIDGTTDRIRFENAELFEIEDPVQASVELRGYRSEIRNDELILYYPSGTQRFSISSTNSSTRRYTGLISEGNSIYFYLLKDGSITLFSPANDYSQKRVITESDNIGWPAITDINKDGETELLFIDLDRNRLVGINREGTLLPSFPISAPQDVEFIGTPLIADLEGDGENDIMISGITPSSSNIYAYNLSGKPKEGFPLLIGGSTNENNLPLLPAITPHYLASISPEGRFKVWYFPGMEEIQWASAYGNDTFNKVTGRIEDGTIQEPDFLLLNKEETYNWPNPARNETMIRYQTSEPAEIVIRVMTQSGRLLEEIRFQNTSTLPSEYRIDTSKWASGAYYALVEARANGRTEQELVKIAIVR